MSRLWQAVCSLDLLLTQPGYLQDTAGQAQDKAGQAKEEGKGYLQTAQEKAGQLFGQTQDKAQQAKGEAKDTLGSTADKASAKADEAHKEGKGEHSLKTCIFLFHRSAIHAS